MMDVHCGQEMHPSGGASVDTPISSIDDEQPTVISQLPGEQEPKTRKKRLVAILGLILVVIVVVIVVVTLQLSGANSNEVPNASETGDEDEFDPAELDTAAYQERFRAIRTAVGGFSASSTLVETNTPQSKAVEWLVYRDTTLQADADDFQKKLQQRYAVMVFYYACAGEEWQGYDKPLEKLPDQSECDWDGFFCNNADELIEINLEGLRVSGQLPVELGLLTDLRTLNLADNFLEGPIPGELLEPLVKLETFNLYKNEFSSTLPDEISQLPKLAHLFVGYNSLTGELPEGMAGMTTLKSLGLSYNRLKGEDLFERFVVTWPALQVLTLDSTLFTGGIPPSIGDLTNLQVLSIDKTLFEGNLPTELNLLTGLTKLDLYGSDLSGEIPDLGELTRLEHLALEGRSLTGTLPASIGELTALTSLQIHISGISGTIPTEIGLCRSLIEVSFIENLFQGTIPSELGAIPTLRQIHIYDNGSVMGSLPETFCNRPELEIIRDCLNACSCCVNDQCYTQPGEKQNYGN